MSTWLALAVCPAFPDLFCTRGHQKDAVHICRHHCPVKDECHNAFKDEVNREIVVGGYAYGVNGEVLEKIGGPGDVKLHNPWCRALEGLPEKVPDGRSRARKKQKEAG